eukprot:g20878.t1
MLVNGNALLPRADQLVRNDQLVQEHIRKKLQKQDFEQSVKAQLQTKHSHRRQKVLVVANRLPTKPKRDADGNWTFERCSGGLVSCLAGIRAKFDMVWLGWPGADFNDVEKDIANEIFTEAILSVYEDDDYVWIHDYHLMLVPKFLREAKPDCNIGWFLHTPFPSAEIYRTLPWRQEIIESLLHANLLGFHVYDYLRHFLSSCVQLTSLEISAHSVDATSIGGCIVTCATVPIGISPDEFLTGLQKPEHDSLSVA